MSNARTCRSCVFSYSSAWYRISCKIGDAVVQDYGEEYSWATGYMDSDNTNNVCPKYQLDPTKLDKD